MARTEDYIADGIEQVDAPVSRWWLRCVLAILAVGVLYMLYYHIGAPGRSMADSYERALAENTRRQFAEIGQLQPDQATILRYMERDSWVKVGKVVFKTHCATCHGREAEGNVGPNLTDEHYKNVREIADIAEVILMGANNNAMPGWKDKLHPNEIVLLAAYVASLRGTFADGGKAAEGIRIDEWPPAPPEESPQEADVGTVE